MEMTSSIIRPADSYRYLAHSAGGEEQVGHTMKDHLNFVNHEKIKIIEGGDAKTFMKDSMMQEDFGIYGDVVVFDIAYKINKI
ncbi:hypothetical protein ACS0TY_034096 [Phlomoides rotata]